MGSRKNKDIIQFILIIGIIILVNVIGSLRFFRLDLTAEKRYSLSEATTDLLTSFDEVLYIKVYLEGDFPAGFQRLQRETRQMLDEFRAYNGRIEYQFINPDASDDERDNAEIKQQLQYKGLKPFTLQVREKSGDSRLEVYPGAIMTYGDREVPVQLLLDQFAASPEAQINNSIQNLEFQLANGIRALITTNKPSVGFLYGHGELEPRYIADFARSLGDNYTLDRFDIHKFRSDSLEQNISIQDQQRKLNRFDALIIAKPRQPFSDLDKYLIDQYVMNGGKVVWLIDAVHAEMDSLSEKSQFISFPIYDRLRISDLLFRYGVRVNTNLVQDMISAGVSDRRSVHNWIYFPMVMPQVKHPITKDLNAVKLDFASSLDTIISPGIKKTILLKSSPYSNAVATPHIVSLQRLYEEQNESRFTQRFFPLAVLLEGRFESAFKNRILPKDNGPEQLTLKEKGDKTQMVVIGDGDIIRNQLNVINPNIPKGTPLPLGFDQFTGQQYGNKDLLLNIMDYMLDESGLISIRSRELKLRLLNPKQVKAEKLYWQLLNTLAPVIVIIVFGVTLTFIRKRKYA